MLQRLPRPMAFRLCRFLSLLVPISSIALHAADHRDHVEPGAADDQGAAIEIGASSALSFVQSESVQQSRSALRLVKHSRRLKEAVHAVVTHICDDSWVPGALALGASLHKFKPAAEIVVMISHNVSLDHQHLMGTVFDKVYQEQPITPHPSITRKGSDCVTLQLRTWTLPYQKALYMDADMIGLTNPDPLFDQYGELAAKADNEKEKKVKYGWNGGMFMTEPQQATFTKLEDALHKYRQHTTRTGIQQFLNHMYPKCGAGTLDPQSAGCWGQNLSVTHNRFSRELTPADIASLLGDNFSKHSSLHFSGDWDMPAKPWMVGCMGHADSTTKFDGKLRNDLLNLWMREFRRVKAPEGVSERLLDVDCPAYSCAESKASLDYVMLAKDLANCVTRAAISRLARHAQPRRIVLIVPAGTCHSAQFQHLSDIVTQLKSNLQCVEESSVLAEVSRDSIKTWLHGKFGKVPFDQEKSNTYLVDNSQLKAKTRGLSYYIDKKKAALVQSAFWGGAVNGTALWGKIVNGTDEGDGWIRTHDGLYLPKTLQGSTVLRKMSEEEYSLLSAGRSFDQDLAEEYHQKILKLAVADKAERLGLSEPYVMWESNALLLRDFCPLNPKGQINFMEAAEEPAEHCKASGEGFAERVMGQKYARSSRNGMSFSSRHMVVDRQAMSGVLAALRAQNSASGVPADTHWSASLLDAACPTMAACACGVSEHALYATSMRSAAPEKFAEVAQQEGKAAPKETMCCPHEYKFDNELRRGFVAVNFDRSSKASCGYTKDISSKEKEDLLPKASPSFLQTTPRGALLRTAS